MAPITQAATNSDIAGAVKQGNALQNTYNTQASQLKGQYGTDVGQSNIAYNNLQNYNNTIQGGGSQYGTYLNGAMALSGYNPAGVQSAVSNLNRLQLNAANLVPMTQAGAGNAYGSSGAQIANAYGNTANNLAQGTQGEQGYLTNQNNFLNSAANIANQQATQQLTSEQLKSQNYQQLYSTSVAQMQAAGQTMAQIEGLQQQQGYLTAEQVNQYQSAYNGLVTAQAAAQNAQAQMVSAQAAASIAPSTIAYNQAQAKVANLQATKDQQKNTTPKKAATPPKTTSGPSILSTIKSFASRNV